VNLRKNYRKKMNIIRKLYTKLIYLRIQIFGDKDLYNEGSSKGKGFKILPCINCGQKIKSMAHFGEGPFSTMVFDCRCRTCLNEYNKTHMG
jgi:hypothetical protein